jgi:hypothetical protein
MRKAVSLRCLIIFTCLVIGFCTTATNAVAQKPEYQLKATFLCVFGDVIIRKNDPEVGTAKPLSIGVLGRDPFDATLTDGRRLNYLDLVVAAKVRGGRKINVQRFAAPDEYQPCNLLFVARDAAQDAQTLQATLEATRGEKLLLVTDAPGLARKGAAINMKIVGGLVQLEINPDAAQRASLSIPPEVLNLPGVTIVRDANP